ncbi:MAG: ADP-ribose pyrophosphatase [Pseudoalteromonas rhizosphaerae]|jgi:ADP-ribose pyrophosphatase|uniref:ADP-ribose pyrophosphatase n=1 Tax=Pseudoalteromonas neustonica TaxID=1840331 RepID=A0ABY3FHD1_9GAMM|nr:MULTISPECIES: NUDIX domain-containing protein [Pseudoalteromonas]MBB1301177.1 NUDIX domain-containing protein [Pseudoalteromonas sp. SR44-8]MBB1309702.1 NUDIX domain-containing protein [Pseudoalteromonas sp. SR41-8]MBB1397039.1 NUDIX domain-containing protein [Pseudoalteromonas sp. SG44-8]MBB1505289.1 NUDIX domain-containing protein [Pseudoalteromonas sp. SG41-1]TVU85132.1 NUDIX domain-containing protein [Pseudoalteromonas neustonica]|tara:strand:- start:32233 stop:32862 length:630 start_codon:yes stop_codon:yes gene_type:complete
MADEILTKFTKQDVIIAPIKVLYNGFFKINLYQFEHALFAGGQSATIRREILERGDAVAVLPYDPVTDCILLIEQIRIGAIKSKQSPWLLECIAGMTDGSTNYEDVVRREAFEEAGLVLSELEFMLSYLSSPGGTTERLHLYLAKTDLSQLQSGVYGLATEGEDIKTHILSFDDAMARLATGEIDNAASVISLQWLALNRERIINNQRS